MKKLLKKLSVSKGFTLIELLIVITIISALAIAVFVALNPAQRIKDANDARRAADADTILTAIHASIVDSKGSLPLPLTTSYTEKQIGVGVTGCDGTAGVVGVCTGIPAACADFDASNTLDKYLKSIPIDPLGGTTYTANKTGYSVSVDANNIVTIKACGTQGATVVSVSR